MSDVRKIVEITPFRFALALYIYGAT